MSFEPVIPAGTEAATDRFHFSAAVRVDDLVLCSGQIGTADDGTVPDDGGAPVGAGCGSGVRTRIAGCDGKLGRWLLMGT